MRQFMDLFKFDVSKTLFIGVERECFLTDKDGRIQPLASEVVHSLVGYDTPDFNFGYELSACQLECRVGPTPLVSLHSKLEACDQQLVEKEASLRFKRLFVEVGPEDMPLDVYPDPSGRYQEIVKTMPRHILLAACRVIGTHVHIGMPDHETALKVYNYVIKKCDWLCHRGNGSFGERLDIYRIVAPDCDPQPYADWSDFHRVAVAKGFDKDPRKCWTLIRISKHGTIEFRMFGTTPSLERIVGWAKLCHDLCQEAMGESECKISRVDVGNIPADTVKQWTELYCEIWKEAPWNEDFWKPSEVWREIYREITDNQHGEAFLAIDDCKVVGFTHGYSVSCQEMREIAGSGLLDGLFERTERVYYIDELGVAKEYRGRHISVGLTRSLMQAAQNHGLTCITLRTDKQAGAARHLYQKLGFMELSVCDAKYPDRTYWVLRF